MRSRVIAAACAVAIPLAGIAWLLHGCTPKAVDCRVEFAAKGLCPCDAGRDVGGE